MDVIYYPRTSQIILPTNAWIPEAIHYLYNAYIRLAVGDGGVNLANTWLRCMCYPSAKLNIMLTSR